MAANVAALPDDVPVSYVDAYFLFENHPRVAAACDPLLINCYPFWESCPFEYALHHMQEMYRRTQRVAGGKKISASLEDYLEAIYHTVEAKGAARAKDIVMRMGVHNSSVTQALRSSTVPQTTSSSRIDETDEIPSRMFSLSPLYITPSVPISGISRAMSSL